MVPGPWSLVPVCAALLALRKPWALHTPQLWAEDGSIFLTQNEQMGVAAWWEPYNGYLHLLPRLIAWIASHTADVAWWPAIYNGLAFVLNVAVFARLASPRVELPHKPALMLAFVLVVGTGEVLINVTNLQWVTAFFLVLQLFTQPVARASRPWRAPRAAIMGETPMPRHGRDARATLGASHPSGLEPPATRAWLRRVGDLAILVVVGLNGPFAIVFLPLFAWRAWRERNVDTFLALGAIAFCALVQGAFVSRVGLSLQDVSQPFQPVMFLSAIGSRLVTWPVLGPLAVRAWPVWVHAMIAVVVIGPLLAWALRADSRRPIRAMLVATFCLVTIACAYRMRFDRWQYDDLLTGDRYFYIPRVLLAWLVILEFDAARRWIAWTARAVCVVGVLMHVPTFIIPAPPDYRWAEHCDPIRRGVPANIYTLPEGWWIEYPGRPQR